MEAQEQQEDIGGSSPRDPEELLAEGKKCLAAADAAGAVESFQEACALLTAAHGQLAKELAEPYYLYGRALLELARQENTVLGAGIPVPEENSSSEEEDEDGMEEGAIGKEDGVPSAGDSEPLPAMEEGGPEPSSTAATSDTPSGSVPSEVVSGETTTPSGVTSGDASGSSGVTSGSAPGPSGVNSTGAPGPSGLNEVGQAEEGEEEESDLKLAWEVLELARVICQRQDGDEFKLKLADVNLALGDVGLESDQAEQAIGDILSGLGILREVLEPTDRRLAEAYFNLGLAYSLSKQYEPSIEQYKCAKEVIEKRKAKLEGEMAEKSESDRKTLEDEIQELEALLPDLESKVLDAQDMAKAAEEQDEGEPSTTTTGFGQQPVEDQQAQTIGVRRQAAVNDISHLVRKRPAEESSGGEEKAAKRLCTEEGRANNGGITGTDASETTRESEQ